MPAARSLIPVCARYSIRALSPEGKRRNARPDHSSVVSGAPVKEGGPAVARQLRNLPLLASYIWSSCPVRSLSFLSSPRYFALLSLTSGQRFSLSLSFCLSFSLFRPIFSKPFGENLFFIFFLDSFPRSLSPSRRSEEKKAKIPWHDGGVALSRTTTLHT